MMSATRAPPLRTKRQGMNVIFLTILFVLIAVRVMEMPRLHDQLTLPDAGENGFTGILFANPAIRAREEIEAKTKTKNTRRPLRFAIISSHVVTDVASEKNAPRVDMLDHLLNKACYADLWGYDFIMNTTYGFNRSRASKAHWLKYGTWHRVPHIQDALERNEYDWILYADIDYVIQDMTIPLESFVREFDLYGKNNVHVVLPDEWNEYYTFSAFCVFVRNSPFGRRLIENWNDFADGLCPKGNFPSIPGVYEWTDTDQPGLWYSLMKTHHEFYPDQVPNYHEIVRCDNETGFFATRRFLGPELNIYMEQARAVQGSHGKDLLNLPDDQPIVWSKTELDGRSGIGVQQTFGNGFDHEFPHSFALHTKRNVTDWPARMPGDYKMCKEKRGCFARYNDKGVLEIGCDHNRSAYH